MNHDTVKNDYYWMAKAIQLANKGRFTTSPNPRVGCVIVDEDSQLLGQGYHIQAGTPHAEVHALRQAAHARSEGAKGATAYVTLEPCSHFGRTPPCAKALVEAQVARVVIAMTDPNPNVCGNGISMLQEAGIEVVSEVMAAEAAEMPVVTPVAASIETVKFVENWASFLSTINGRFSARQRSCVIGKHTKPRA